VPHFASETDKVCRQSAFGSFPFLDEIIGAGAERENKEKQTAIAICFSLSNQDGKTIAEKALFYKGFGRFSHCKFHFALLVFEPLTPMYFIKIFRSIKIVCGYTKKSPLNRTHWFGFER